MTKDTSLVISSFPEEEESSLSWILNRVLCKPTSWSDNHAYAPTAKTFLTNSDSGYFDWTPSMSRSSSNGRSEKGWSEYDLQASIQEEEENNTLMKQKDPYFLPKSTSLLSSIIEFIPKAIFGTDQEDKKHCQSMFEIETNQLFEEYLRQNQEDNFSNNNFVSPSPTNMSSIRKASESQIPSVAEEHYRRLLSQISLSNCSLVRENEAMRERLNELEGLLDDHMKHLKSIYFTLHKKGYSKLEFPDGDEVNLAQFEGLLLNFKRSSISGESNGHHHSGGSYLNGTLSGHQYPGSSSLLTDLPTIQEPTTTH